MPKTKPKIIVVLGPTSSGKTSLAIDLAKKFGCEVVSADSRQVYRSLDLGTGKVTASEMRGIPHHMLDVASPKKQYSVSMYGTAARAAIADIISRGKVPIIAGGTGFYIDTLVSGVTLPEVPPNPALRKKLESKSCEALLRILQKLDPARAKTIDSKNPVRLIRAIEIATKLGKVPKLKKTTLPYEVLKIGLDMPDDILKERISTRLYERIAAGMLKEGTKLHKGGLTYLRMRQLGLEYGHMADLLLGKTKRESFEERLSRDIWQYAKRQRTWFKRDTDTIWLNPLKKTELQKINATVKKFLTAREP